MKKLSSREKRGWMIVAYGVLVMATINYITYNARSLLLIPQTTDLNVSRSAISLSGTVGSIVGMCLSAPLGKVVADRRRNLKLLTVLFIAVAGIFTALQATVHSVGALYVLAAFRAASVLIPISFAFPQFISRWMPENAGVGFSIVMIGAAIGGIVLPTPLTKLIETQGWRPAIALCGAACALIVAPLGLLALKNLPEEEPAGESKTAAKLPAADFEPLKDKRFWLVTAGLSLCYFCGPTLYHFVPAIQSVGFSALFAAKLVSLYSIINIGAKLLVGRLFDRKGVRGGTLFTVLGMLVLYVSAILSCTQGGAVFAYGMSLGHSVSLVGYGTIIAPLLIRVFGPEKYGLAHGKTYFFTCASGALGDLFLARCFDKTGSYLAAWIVFLVLSVITLFLFLRLAAVCRREAEKV